MCFCASATLLCLQIEEGLCEGAVLYHAHVNRSKAETSAQQAAKDEAAKLKAARRQQQEENVRRKEVCWHVLSVGRMSITQARPAALAGHSCILHRDFGTQVGADARFSHKQQQTMSGPACGLYASLNPASLCCTCCWTAG